MCARDPVGEARLASFPFMGIAKIDLFRLFKLHHQGDIDVLLFQATLILPLDALDPTNAL